MATVRLGRMGAIDTFNACCAHPRINLVLFHTVLGQASDTAYETQNPAQNTV